MNDTAHTAMTPMLIDSLYGEAMALADDARSYFDKIGRWDRQQLSPMDRVVFSCESLKLTTRVMHVISWLLIRKAVLIGEMDTTDANRPDRRLGRASSSYEEADERLACLPPFAMALIRRSQDIYDRVSRLEAQIHQEEVQEQTNPTHALLAKLERSL